MLILSIDPNGAALGDHSRLTSRNRKLYLHPAYM